MDFAFSEEQQALRDLAAEILADRCTHERLQALEADGGSVFDRELWQAFAGAGILGAVVPEEHGGAGLGLAALLGVLEAAGEHVAPLPLVPTLAMGAVALTRWGTPAQQARWLPCVAAGERVLTAALEEGTLPHPRAVTSRLAGRSPVSATGESTRSPDVTGGEGAGGPGWHLHGALAAVPYGSEADRVVVPAILEHGVGVSLVDAADPGHDAVGLFLLDPGAGGVAVTPLLSTNRQPLADLRLDGAAAELLTTEPGAAAWLRERGAAAWCAVQAGICRQALRMISAHTSTRQQFGKPIAEFQAVAQRAADAFVDTEMVRLTAWEAVWRLDAGLPASHEVHVAKFWAGDGGMRVVHAAQHLHGGLGVDVDYPLHRYFLWTKQLEHTLGTPTRELLALGAALADEPV